MILKITSALSLLLLFVNCNGGNTADRNNPVQEIRQTEAAFNRMANRVGVKAAFLAFAADSAVLNRNESIIKGKEEIQHYFDRQDITEVQLQWSPDFVEVSKAGDMAYTYGRYSFSGISAKGDTLRSTGVFHTVWKRQPDGSWKYVYD